MAGLAILILTLMGTFGVMDCVSRLRTGPRAGWYGFAVALIGWFLITACLPTARYSRGPYRDTTVVDLFGEVYQLSAIASIGTAGVVMAFAISEWSRTRRNSQSKD